MVKDWMSADPIVVGPETRLPEAHKLMRAANIRRLPVLQDGRLVGLVTLSDIREASPRSGSSYNIYDLNFSLSVMTVGEIMAPDPVCIDVHATVPEAARLMLAHKISGLPVLEAGRLVGIITESDIFRLLADS
jgi:CBS domain-containing protein